MKTETNKALYAIGEEVYKNMDDISEQDALKIRLSARMVKDVHTIRNVAVFVAILISLVLYWDLLHCYEYCRR